MHATVRRTSFALAALTLLACAGERSAPTAPNTFIVPLYSNGSSDGTSHHSVSPLSGDNEVPPVNTRAVGNAVFWLSEDGTDGPDNSTCNVNAATVPISNVIGKAVVIAWPPSRWTTLGTPKTFTDTSNSLAASGVLPLLVISPLVFAVRRRRRRR